MLTATGFVHQGQPCDEAAVRDNVQVGEVLLTLVDGLANQMLDRIRDRDLGGAKKPGEKTVGNDGIETPKRVKRKLIFGNIL